jgi:hypothetical protein
VADAVAAALTDLVMAARLPKFHGGLFRGSCSESASKSTTLKTAAS